MLQAVAIEIEILPWVLQNYITSNCIFQRAFRPPFQQGWPNVVKVWSLPHQQPEFLDRQRLGELQDPLSTHCQNRLFPRQPCERQPSCTRCGLAGAELSSNLMFFFWLVPIHGWTHVFNWLWRSVFRIDFQILENYYKYITVPLYKASQTIFSS